MDEKTVSVETLKLSKKSSEYLKNRGIHTVEDLMHMSMPELLGAEGLELWMAAEIFWGISTGMTFRRLSISRACITVRQQKRFI